jgi:hypothetical protein
MLVQNILQCVLTLLRGPVIDEDGYAVGIISRVGEKYSYMSPFVGVLNFSDPEGK